MEFRKFVQLSMLLALAVVLNIIETLIPFFYGIIPGLKLGIANIIILFVLYYFSFKDALIVTILKVFLLGILRNGIFSPAFFFSLSGGILSILMMGLFKKYTKLSIIGISIIGSIFHSIGQVIMAIVIIDTTKIIFYLPWLLLFAIPTGIIVGIVGKELVNYFELWLLNFKK